MRRVELERLARETQQLFLRIGGQVLRIGLGELRQRGVNDAAAQRRARAPVRAGQAARAPGSRRRRSHTGWRSRSRYARRRACADASATGGRGAGTSRRGAGGALSRRRAKASQGVSGTSASAAPMPSSSALSRKSQRDGTVGTPSIFSARVRITSGDASSVAKSWADWPIFSSGEGSPSALRMGRLSHGPGSADSGHVPSFKRAEDDDVRLLQARLERAPDEDARMDGHARAHGLAGNQAAVEVGVVVRRNVEAGQALVDEAGEEARGGGARLALPQRRARLLFGRGGHLRPSPRRRRRGPSRNRARTGGRACDRPRRAARRRP